LTPLRRKEELKHNRQHSKDHEQWKWDLKSSSLERRMKKVETLRIFTRKRVKKVHRGGETRVVFSITEEGYRTMGL